MTDTAAEELPDDPSIADDVKLLRRVVPGRYSSEGCPESSTFDKDGDEDGTSVTLWLSEADLEIVLRDHADFGVVCITARQARDAGLRIAFTEEAGNPHHCELMGARTKGKRKQLARDSRWVVYPQGFPEDLRQPPVQLDS